MKNITQNKDKVIVKLRENLSEQARGQLGAFIVAADGNVKPSKTLEIVAAGAAVIAMKEFLQSKKAKWDKNFSNYCKHIAASFLRDYVRKRKTSESSSLPVGTQENPIKVFVEDMAEWLDMQKLGTVFELLDAKKSESATDILRPVRKILTFRRESESRYTILHKGIMIGSLKTIIIGSPEDRIWNIKLIDRFEEHKFPTGHQYNMPYTEENAVDQVILIHPTRMTHLEAKAWLKLNVVF